MDKLNYDVLDQLDDHNRGLEVTNVDVKRLRDDRSEIQIGQEIAFVATATFRITKLGVSAINKVLGGADLAVGDELLTIGTDAEVRSDRVAIDEDSVGLWLSEHYQFKFLLNGKASGVFNPVGSVRLNTDSPDDRPERLELPWLRKLNTASVKEDYIDVDVVIDERAPPAAPPPPPAPELWALVTSDGVVVENDEREVELGVAFEVAAGGRPLDEMIGRRFRVVARPDDDDCDDDTELALVLEVVAREPMGHEPGGHEPGGKPRRRHGRRAALVTRPAKQEP